VERLAPDRLDAFLRLRPAWAMERFMEDIPRFAVRAAPRAAPRAAVAAPRAVVRAPRAAVRAPRVVAADVLRVERAVFLREPAEEERELVLRRDPADAERPAVLFFREPDALRDRLEEDRDEAPPLDERRDELVLRVPPGRTFTARLARSAMVPAAVVTTEPTVLAAVPTPEATVSNIPPLLSSAIIPPRKPRAAIAVAAGHAFLFDGSIMVRAAGVVSLLLLPPEEDSPT
jgi:hypothetical protein